MPSDINPQTNVTYMFGDHLQTVRLRIQRMLDQEMVSSLLSLPSQPMSPEERERRDAEHAARRTEDKRRTAEARTALGLIQHPVARLVLDLHKEEGTIYVHCTGCDFAGFEAEEPEYPCRTVVEIAKHFAIEMPERWTP